MILSTILMLLAMGMSASLCLLGLELVAVLHRSSIVLAVATSIFLYILAIAHTRSLIFIASILVFVKILVFALQSKKPSLKIYRIGHFLSSYTILDR